jgi:peptidoglycan/xylan/chitin deacetylase (PgdA/CDA1 family)
MPKPTVTTKPEQKFRAYVGLDSLQGTWSDGLLVLMYHAIEAQSPKDLWKHLYVDPSHFRHQLSELLASSARFVPADCTVHFATRERRVLVTLDDGFQNAYVNALPILRDLGVPAIAYIVAGQIGGSNVWDHAKGLQKKPLMTSEEILEWVDAGYDIGAHSMTHCDLTHVPLEVARREIFDSKKVLEDLIGRPVRHFCYPFGGINPDVRDLVIEAGFETATTCEVGYNFPDTDKFALRRVIACH